MYVSESRETCDEGQQCVQQNSVQLAISLTIYFQNTGSSTGYHVQKSRLPCPAAMEGRGKESALALANIPPGQIVLIFPCRHLRKSEAKGLIAFVCLSVRLLACPLAPPPLHHSPFNRSITKPCSMGNTVKKYLTLHKCPTQHHVQLVLQDQSTKRVEVY